MPLDASGLLSRSAIEVENGPSERFDSVGDGGVVKVPSSEAAEEGDMGTSREARPEGDAGERRPAPLGGGERLRWG